MTTIIIHSSLIPLSEYYKKQLRQQTFASIQNTYHTSGRLYKVWYYFFEHEIKQHTYKDFLKKHTNQEEFINDTEAQSYANRANLLYHYDFGSPLSQKKLPHIVVDSIDTTINEYIMQTGLFEDMDDENATKVCIKKLHDIFTQNPDIQAFFEKEFSDSLDKGFAYHDSVGTDLYLQLPRYRANRQLIKKLQTSQTDQDMQQNILQYIQTYKEIPLCIRILKTPVKNITTSTIQSQDTQKIRDILATNAYTVHITAIDTPPLATDTYKNNIYTQPLAVKAGLWFKQQPRRTTVLISLALIGATALIGSGSIFLLPVYVFFKQYIKSVADIAEHSQALLHGSLTDFLMHKEQYTALTRTGGFARTTIHKWYKNIPQILWDTTYHDGLLQSNTQQEARSMFAYVYEAQQAGLPVLIPKLFGDTDTYAKQTNNESKLLDFLQKIITLFAVEGKEIPQKVHNKDEQQTYGSKIQESIKQAIQNTRQASQRYASIDAGMSAIITLATGLFSSMYLQPLTAQASAYASHTTTQLFIDPEENIRAELRDMQTASHHDIIQKINLTDGYHVQGNSVMRDAFTQRDPYIQNSIAGLLGNDIETLQQALFAGDVDKTLRETLVRLYGYEQGNAYSHKILSVLRQAQDEQGVSELFLLAQKNDLFTQGAEDQWERIKNILTTAYGYKGYESHQQWIDKERVLDAFATIYENSMTVETIADTYNSEQIDVLVQAAFGGIKQENITELFLDSYKEQIVGKITTSSVTTGTIATTGTIGTTGTLTPHTPIQEIVPSTSNVGWLQSTPVIVGKNEFGPQTKKQS